MVCGGHAVILQWPLFLFSHFATIIIAITIINDIIMFFIHSPNTTSLHDMTNSILKMAARTGVFHSAPGFY